MKKATTLLTFLTVFGLTTQSYGASLKTNTLHEIQGIYEGCAPSIHGGNLYDYYKITVEHSGKYERYAELHYAPDCSDEAINKISFDYKVKELELVDDNNGVRTYLVTACDPIKIYTGHIFFVTGFQTHAIKSL